MKETTHKNIYHFHRKYFFNWLGFMYNVEDKYPHMDSFYDHAPTVDRYKHFIQVNFFWKRFVWVLNSPSTGQGLPLRN